MIRVLHKGNDLYPEGVVHDYDAEIFETEEVEGSEFGPRVYLYRLDPPEDGRKKPRKRWVGLIPEGSYLGIEVVEDAEVS